MANEQFDSASFVQNVLSQGATMDQALVQLSSEKRRLGLPSGELSDNVREAYARADVELTAAEAKMREQKASPIQNTTYRRGE